MKEETVSAEKLLKNTKYLVPLCLKLLNSRDNQDAVEVDLKSNCAITISIHELTSEMDLKKISREPSLYELLRACDGSINVSEQVKREAELILAKYIESRKVSVEAYKKLQAAVRQKELRDKRAGRSGEDFEATRLESDLRKCMRVLRSLEFEKYVMRNSNFQHMSEFLINLVEEGRRKEANDEELKWLRLSEYHSRDGKKMRAAISTTKRSYT